MIQVPKSKSLREPVMNTVHVKALPALVRFEFTTDDPKFRNRLFGAIFKNQCPDFECSLGSPSGTGSSYTALWRAEHADAVQAWARSSGIHITKALVEGGMIHLKLPNIGDIALGVTSPCFADAARVVRLCFADAERMLGDQGLAPTALNWLAICDHFLSLPLIRLERAAAFRLLRQAIERTALGAVRMDPHSARQVMERAALGGEDGPAPRASGNE